MHLVYLDESGNSGIDLNNAQQPIFLLCAMIIDEGSWLALETDLKKVLDDLMPAWRTTPGFEVHCSDLRTGHGHFKGLTVAKRIEFRDAWMAVGVKHKVKLISRSVHKKRYAKWLAEKFGSGIVINPHIVAFAIISRCVNNYLKDLDGAPLGMLISDENKEIVADIEKSISVLRVLEGSRKLSQIIEKGFFIDSSKSLPLQLCDLFAMSLRKQAERSWKAMPEKSIDDSGIKIAESLSHTDSKDDKDVLSWLEEQHKGAKKEAARG